MMGFTIFLAVYILIMILLMLKRNAWMTLSVLLFAMPAGF